MNTIVFSIGSNFNREQNMAVGLDALFGIISSLECSEVYESEPYHTLPDMPPYLNAVAAGKCELDYEPLNQTLKLIERSCGRSKEGTKKGIIPLDIDIVVWNGEVMRPSDYNAPFFRRGYNQIVFQDQSLKTSTSTSTSPSSSTATSTTLSTTSPSLANTL